MRPAAEYPPIGYPGIGVISTFAEPTRNSPVATAGLGIGNLPEMLAQLASIQIRRLLVST
jgi:hypothetical protein